MLRKDYKKTARQADKFNIKIAWKRKLIKSALLLQAALAIRGLGIRGFDYSGKPVFYVNHGMRELLTTRTFFQVQICFISKSQNRVDSLFSSTMSQVFFISLSLSLYLSLSISFFITHTALSLSLSISFCFGEIYAKITLINKSK